MKTFEQWLVEMGDESQWEPVTPERNAMHRLNTPPATRPGAQSFEQLRQIILSLIPNKPQDADQLAYQLVDIHGSTEAALSYAQQRLAKWKMTAGSRRVEQIQEEIDERTKDAKKPNPLTDKEHFTMNKKPVGGKSGSTRQDKKNLTEMMMAPPPQPVQTLLNTINGSHGKAALTAALPPEAFLGPRYNQQQLDYFKQNGLLIQQGAGYTLNPQKFLASPTGQVGWKG